MTRVVIVKCPKCNKAITTKTKDLIFYCTECGTLHTRNGGIKILEHEIGRFSAPRPAAQKIYMPVWRLFTQFTILSERVEGGTLYKIAKFLIGDNRTGSVHIHVPAIDLSPEQFMFWSSMLTNLQPQYSITTKFDPDAIRLPCVLTEKEAEQLADFIVLTNEAEKPGVLQKLTYELKIAHTKLIYLPFYMQNGQYQLAI